MMVLNENDMTRNPTKFIIIAGVRSGGTLLAHSLDSHPLIFCTRGEPVHSKSEWYRIGITSTLNILTNMTGYVASGLKIQNDQLSYGPVEDYIVDHKVKIIRLIRENLFNQAISVVINNKSRANILDGIIVPQHSFTKVADTKFELPPQHILKACLALRDSNLLVSLTLKDIDLPIYNITYEEMTQGTVMIQELPYELTGKLCKYLGVRRAPLRNFLYRINSLPYSETILNWEEIKEEISVTEYGIYL